MSQSGGRRATQQRGKAWQRVRSGTESKQQHEANFSKCSALCSSTTVDAVSFHDIPRSSGGLGLWPGPTCGWVVGGRRSVGRSRPQRAIYYAIVARKKIARTAAQRWALARSPRPPGAPRIRARGQGAYRLWEGGKGAVGDQECQESVRRDCA